MSIYLITFDMKTKCLTKKSCTSNQEHAYTDIIKQVMGKHSFNHIQDGLYRAKRHQ